VSTIDARVILDCLKREGTGGPIAEALCHAAYVVAEVAAEPAHAANGRLAYTACMKLADAIGAQSLRELRERRAQPQPEKP
jgi:hypothetical protein